MLHVARISLVALGVAVLLGSAAHASPAPVSAAKEEADVRVWTIYYRSHRGQRRKAHVVLPSWYGPTRNPPLPLIISPHGRGIDSLENARVWGLLPALGRFAVVNPEGEGRRLKRFSWGYKGQISDLARMPRIVKRGIPWLRINRSAIYAFGNSMGGEEALLLAARNPRLLAGTAVFDPVTDLARQYYNFPRLGCAAECRRVWNGPIGKKLQQMARFEVGGAPSAVPRAYARRSPITFARSLAFSRSPIQVWWSTLDRVVTGQRWQSGALVDRIRALNRASRLEQYIGVWEHGRAMTEDGELPTALIRFGLLDPADDPRR